MRRERGITLVALIITIIILIILTAITISNVMNSNLFGLAKGAAENYIQAGKEESGTIDNLLSRVETMGKQPNETKDEDLYRYILGKEKTGRDMSEISNVFEAQAAGIRTLKFTPDGEMETDISDKISGLTSGHAKLNTKEEVGKNIYIKYEDKVYRITLKVINSKICSTTLTKVYEPRGNEGKTVQYSYDGRDENKKEWTIIKDNQNGTVDIVSPDTLGELTLGESGNATSDYPDVENLKKSIENYNKAIEKINDKCKEVVTNPNKVKVRSVGAEIDNTNNKFTYDKVTEWANEQQFLSSYNGRGKEGDTYYEDDLVRMSYYDVLRSSNNYWFASRSIDSTTNDYVGFHVAWAGDKDNIAETNIWWIAPDMVCSEDRTYGVRPVVTINYPISEQGAE